MGPRCLTQILSDPDLGLRAYVLGINNEVTAILPKNWRQYKDRLTTSEPNAPDLITRTTLEILPVNTFVHWDGLWRTHEACFLPDRALISTCTLGEQEEFMLQPMANFPDELETLIFEGFPDGDPLVPVSPAPKGPEPITSREIAHSFDGLKWRSPEEWMKPLGYPPKWLATCKAVPGQQGISQTLWNPVLIGAQLIRRDEARVKDVKRRFQTKFCLKSWEETWNDYEADNFSGL